MSDSTQPQPSQGSPEPGGYPAPGAGHLAPGAQPPGAGDQFPTAFAATAPPPPFAGEVPVYDRGTPGPSRRTIVLAAAVALVVGLAGGFAAGRQTAPKGPATLAEAVRLASEDRIPVGDLSSLRGNGGLGNLLRRGAGGQGQGAPRAARRRPGPLARATAPATAGRAASCSAGRAPGASRPR